MHETPNAERKILQNCSLQHFASAVYYSKEKGNQPEGTETMTTKTLWEKSAIALADSFAYYHDELELQYQLYRNVMEAFGMLHDAKVQSHGEVRHEIDEELAMMLDWFDAFDEIDDYSGEFTSEEMLAELS